MAPKTKSQPTVDDLDEASEAPPAVTEVPLAEQRDEIPVVVDDGPVEVPLAEQRDVEPGADPGPLPGFVRLYHTVTGGQQDAPESLVEHYSARGWATSPATPDPEED